MEQNKHIHQVIPSGGGLSKASKHNIAPDFQKHRQELLAHLSKQSNDPTWYSSAFNPYPLNIPHPQLDLQGQLHEALSTILPAVVENYFKDDEIQTSLSLAPEIFSSLQKLKQAPFRTGSFRPDFLHGLDGIKICEINARFPANAYFISHYLNNLVSKLTYLEQSALLPIKNPDHVPDTFIRHFDGCRRIYIFKQKEKGWDRSFFQYELARHGFKIVEVFTAKEQMGVLQEAEKTHADSAGLSGIFLELHQEELTAEVEGGQLLAALCRNHERFVYLNDPRTIFLLHDKRLLALLCQSKFNRRFLADDQADLLASHIVPTWVLGQSPEIAAKALQKQQNFVLKPNLHGKGEGIVFGKSVSANLWQVALTKYENRDYILQENIQQETFTLYCAVKDSQQAELKEMKVVGTLLCFGDQFFGPGIYRASQGDIVNVAGGGTVLIPVQTDKNKEAHK